nr:hypothetical transcript [Hymenolepis microstoma]
MRIRCPGCTTWSVLSLPRKKTRHRLLNSIFLLLTLDITPNNPHGLVSGCFYRSNSKKESSSQGDSFDESSCSLESQLSQPQLASILKERRRRNSEDRLNPTSSQPVLSSRIIPSSESTQRRNNLHEQNVLSKINDEEYKNAMAMCAGRPLPESMELSNPSSEPPTRKMYPMSMSPPRRNRRIQLHLNSNPTVSGRSAIDSRASKKFPTDLNGGSATKEQLAEEQKRLAILQQEELKMICERHRLSEVLKTLRDFLEGCQLDVGIPTEKDIDDIRRQIEAKTNAPGSRTPR